MILAVCRSLTLTTEHCVLLYVFNPGKVESTLFLQKIQSLILHMYCLQGNAQHQSVVCGFFLIFHLLLAHDLSQIEGKVCRFSQLLCRSLTERNVCHAGYVVLIFVLRCATKKIFVTRYSTKYIYVSGFALKIFLTRTFLFFEDSLHLVTHLVFFILIYVSIVTHKCKLVQ